MKQNSKALYHLVLGGMIAAIYAVVTVLIAPMAFGPLQCRLSEALTILPLFHPAPIWGLTLGCAISNFVSVMMGNAIAGPWDILFGTLATLFAAVFSRMARNVKTFGLPVLSALFPVIINALVVGAELTIVEVGTLDWRLFAVNALLVGAGQFISCTVCGLLLYKPFAKIFARQPA